MDWSADEVQRGIFMIKKFGVIVFILAALFLSHSVRGEIPNQGSNWRFNEMVRHCESRAYVNFREIELTDHTIIMIQLRRIM